MNETWYKLVFPYDNEMGEAHQSGPKHLAAMSVGHGERHYSWVSNIWSLPLDGTPAKQLTNFRSDQIFFHAWSRDGKQLALARGSVTSDAVLISNFR